MGNTSDQVTIKPETQGGIFVQFNKREIHIDNLIACGRTLGG